MLKHLLVVVVEGDAVWLEMLLAPFELILVGREGSDEFSARSLVQDVEGVASAHAAETCNGNLESVRSHLEAISGGVKMLVYGDGKGGGVRWVQNERSKRSEEDILYWLWADH